MINEIQAGLPAAGPVPVEDCLPESIQQNKVHRGVEDVQCPFVRLYSQVGTMLESEEAKWAVEGKRAYHAFSRFIFLEVMHTVLALTDICKGAGLPMRSSGESIQRVRPSAASSERKFPRILERESSSGSMMLK